MQGQTQALSNKIGTANMDARKRKRLEAAGWKIGSVKDFLGLSEEEATLVELKLSLADALRQSRTTRGLS